MGNAASYTETFEGDKAEAVIRKYSYLVKQIAYHLLARLPSSVQVDDLLQAGVIGLLEASQRYDTTKTASFETFAGIRIRGAMLDELRRSSWAPRSVHQNLRRISEAIKKVEARLGREAQSRDIAQELGVGIGEYHAMASNLCANELVAFDSINEESLMSDETQDEPYEKISRDNSKAALVKVMKNLPEREQLILSLYYNEKLNFKEIAEVLGITEARVCQLHGQVLSRLQARL